MSNLEDLRFLKNAINSKVVTNHFKIFQYDENPFLAYQYVREIAKIKELTIQYVESFQEIIDSMSNTLSFDDETYLYVYSCDTFDFAIEDSDKLDNVIVICNKCEETPNVYSFPKLEKWQIIAYMQNKCHGLTNDEIEWLYNITTNTKNNIYRLDAEISKIACFPEEEQQEVFKKLSSSGAYSDLSSLTIFNFTNALVKHDFLAIRNVLEDFEGIDIDAYGLLTILHKNFKQVIDIQLGKNVTAQTLGLSDKQFNAIKYNCGKYSTKALIKIFKFITNIDYQLKSGLLDISDNRLIDYIICNVLSNVEVL